MVSTARRKGLLLLKEGRVKKDLETERRIYFKVLGESDSHIVIFDKERNKFSCDCKFFSLKQKKCSHIIAAEAFLERGSVLNSADE